MLVLLLCGAAWSAWPATSISAQVDAHAIVTDCVPDGCDRAPLDPEHGTTWYVDRDLDGYGDRTDPGTEACARPAGTVADNTDCDDSDPLVHPDAMELLDDSLDNDCDGGQGVSWVEGGSTCSCAETTRPGWVPAIGVIVGRRR